MKIIVKYACGHYALIDIGDADDVTAAKIEAAASRTLCPDCQEREDHEH